ncbi:hypothetical protein V3C85_17705 [Tabrizicola sp. L79]
MRFDFPDDAFPAERRRGAAPVGHLQELPPAELAAIVYLRAWCEGGAERQIISEDFRRVMGDAEGVHAVDTFNALMGVLLRNARRPIMRHGLGCRCFGGDESAFAQMLAAAVSQDRDDAMLFAATLVKGDAAWAAVQLAVDLQQVFLRLTRMPSASQPPKHGPKRSAYHH